MVAGHKDISTGQNFLNRLRFPLLGLWYRLRPRALRSRTILPFYLNHHELIGSGVELGVQRGLFAGHMLRYWQGEHLVCVDPWREFPLTEYDEPKDNITQDLHDEFFRETLDHLEPHGSRARVIRATSVEAAAQIEESSLDFVFIDAQHHYDAVKQDLELWHPKLKQGGLLSGHDWLLDYGPPRFGVKKAVEEFASLHNHQVQVTRDESTWLFHT